MKDCRPLLSRLAKPTPSGLSSGLFSSYTLPGLLSLLIRPFWPNPQACQAYFKPSRPRLQACQAYLATLPPCPSYFASLENLKWLQQGHACNSHYTHDYTHPSHTPLPQSDTHAWQLPHGLLASTSMWPCSWCACFKLCGMMMQEHNPCGHAAGVIVSSLLDR